MSQTLTISDNLYERLKKLAQERGVSIERLIEEWEQNEAQLLLRKDAVREVDELRERLLSKYGEMPDSTELIRDDHALIL